VLTDHAGAIARAYLGHERVESMGLASRGQQGQVWRLATTDGVYAVKELIMRQTEADAQVEVAYQEAVLATGTVAMPRPRRTVDGQVLTEIAGHQVRAYEWVELLPADQRLDPVLVGSVLAAVHQIAFAPARPLHLWYTEPVGSDRWRQLADAARAVRAPFADAFAAGIPALLRLEEVLEAPRHLQNCHRDLWADNMLPLPGGGLCVVDWENCGLEDPGQEIPMSLIDFCFGDLARVAALYAAYLEAGGPGRITGPGSFSMVIAQFGHFWEAAVAGYVAPAASVDAQQRSLERIAELQGTSLQVDHIEAMLDAIATVR